MTYCPWHNSTNFHCKRFNQTIRLTFDIDNGFEESFTPCPILIDHFRARPLSYIRSEVLLLIDEESECIRITGTCWQIDYQELFLFFFFFFNENSSYARSTQVKLCNFRRLMTSFYWKTHLWLAIFQCYRI